jgi:hypothetical protein
VLHLFGAREECGVDLLEPPAEAGERARVRLYRRAAEILQQVVVDMDAIEARLAGKHLIEVGQVIVDKMREWFRWVHA